jgi:hypothetical protein
VDQRDQRDCHLRSKTEQVIPCRQLISFRLPLTPSSCASFEDSQFLPFRALKTALKTTSHGVVTSL